MVQNIIQLYTERSDWFFELTVQHLRLCGFAILIASLLGLALGMLISEFRSIAPAVIGICNVIYTIPSISLLGMLIPFLGIGFKPAFTALCIYGMMPMVRNTYTGICNVDPDIIQAAVGMGSTRVQILFRVRLPLAASVILTGFRSMVVMIISMGGISAYIGAGGLGVAVFRGISIYNPSLTFAGGLLIALMALLADGLIGHIEKMLRKKWRI